MPTTPKAADDKAAPEKTPEPAPRAEERKAEDKPASSGTAYLNTSGGPLVYDRAGHQVAAGEWTPEVNLDKVGQRARQAGHLKPRSAL